MTATTSRQFTLSNSNQNPPRVFLDSQDCEGASSPRALNVLTTDPFMSAQGVCDWVASRHTDVRTVITNSIAESEPLSTQAMLPPRVRPRARSTWQMGQEVASMFNARSTTNGKKAAETFGAIERERMLNGGGDSSIDRLGTQQEKKKPLNFAEAEMAAQKELEEDDYAWYHRNPQRYVWRPRCARKRMHRRKKIMYGIATGEEGAPTNRSLFTAYLLHHYSSTLSQHLIKSDDRKKSSETLASREGTAPLRLTAKNLAVVHKNSILAETQDFQEDLFSPAEDNASSMRGSVSSGFSFSSAASSPQLGYNDKSNHDMMLKFT